MRGIAKRVVPVFVIMLFFVTLDAQRRDVQGRVTDQSGAPVAGAVVELHWNGTAIRSAVTQADGEFAFEVVNPAGGSYDVRVAVPGFTTGPIRLSTGARRKTVRTGRLTVDVQGFSPKSGGPAIARAAPADPLPPPPPPSADPAEGVVPDSTNHAIVPVFFATDRNRVSYTPLVYGAAREPTKQLHLGRIDVSVPRRHHPGLLERPDIWTFWREDPNKHFILVKAQEQGYDDFYRDVAGAVGRSQRREAFVFVHGFNVTFESAVYRTAQMAYDLAFDGAPILYSWPSLGSPTGYPVDANNSEWTIEHLRWFLEDVAAKSGAELVHVIAHSRGNWPTMSALNAMATEPHDGPRARFSQIVLTAPDVDADRFRGLARRFNTVAARTTLYASAHDGALGLSKRYQGYQRAGDVEPQIVVMPGVDSIDVSAVDTSLLGHSYYGDNTSVIGDIARLLRTGSPPERRCGIHPAGDAALRYWTFLAGTACPGDA